ncbi:MAG TPA: hypothetical protein PLB45_01980 [Bacilli bacterium]|jgi:hypothetical protein|nr:hypothetical protein [Bacilli bacterium]HPZ23705.1 hypothetical protein [Bacilli bacterium]HQC83629.1 hypothetical protein [Bacilli bacterium]
MYYEIAALAVIIIFVMQYIGGFNINKFVDDNAAYFQKLKESDFEFYAKAKYGDAIDIDKLFNQRLRDAMLVTLLMGFMFISKFNYLMIIILFAIFLGMFKLPYFKLKKYYKSHLHLIDTQLPYYLKNLEILIQHYTVPVALGKSVGDAPEIFRDGLKDMIEKINAGDSTIQPYMDFAKEFPVRDSMRMMRLLYRLGLGKQERKQEQLLTFSRNVSSLQQKAREARYKERLDKMESKTMQMLIATGAGVMGLLVLSILQTFNAM